MTNLSVKICQDVSTSDTEAQRNYSKKWNHNIIYCNIFGHFHINSISQYQYYTKNVLIMFGDKRRCSTCRLRLGGSLEILCTKKIAM